MNIRRRQPFFAAALCTLLVLILAFGAMSLITGINPASYPYNNYLQQARAWLRGEAALDQNYEFLELAFYNGRYYVSFPPVPSVPMVLYSLVWGDNVPGGLFQKIYIAIACLVALSEIQRTKDMKPRQTFAWGLFFCVASAMLPISLVGGVWYEAQILAFLFSICAVVSLRRRRLTLSCFLYALVMGCRPSGVVLGPVLLMMYLADCRRLRRRSPSRYRPRRCLERLVPGLIVVLCVVAVYAIYNYARFGNIFESGHNYLPESARAEHGQLSFAYVEQNWKNLFFGSPFSIGEGRISINEFGFSMFLSCPILIVNAVWLAQDILRRRVNGTKLMIVLMCALNLLLLLMHRTLGGHQFGAHYALELVPMCFAWYLTSPDRREPARWEVALLVFGFIFNFAGGCLLHI